MFCVINKTQSIMYTSDNKKPIEDIAIGCLWLKILFLLFQLKTTKNNQKRRMPEGYPP